MVHRKKAAGSPEDKTLPFANACRMEMARMEQY